MDKLGIDLSDFGSSAPRPGPKKRSGRRRRRRSFFRTLLYWGLMGLALAVAPFVVLIRVGVAGYQEWALSTWPALGLGVAATALLLGAYAWLVMWRLGAKKKVRRFLSRAAMAVAFVYAGYSLLYVASRNVKDDSVRQGYRALHPLLRVASGTVVLFDSEAVITDTGRTLQDYARMGLEPNEASLHLPGADGRVHALDLRTVGRPEWRNGLLQWYFRAMGFRTLRHVGTADHLHVSLQPTGR